MKAPMLRSFCMQNPQMRRERNMPTCPNVNIVFLPSIFAYKRGVYAAIIFARATMTEPVTGVIGNSPPLVSSSRASNLPTYTITALMPEN